jgi:PAS domain S-box-containing protein
VKRIISGERIEHVETERLTKGGERISVWASMSPIFADDGSRIATTVISRDVTQQRLEQERFRLAIEASPSGMIMADAEGRIRLANAKAERMFGYDPDELLGTMVDDLLPKRMRGDHPSLRRGYLVNPDTRNMGEGRDLFGARKDGSEFPVEVGLNPLSMGEGQMVLAVVVDISARKEIEAKIAESNETLQRSNAELEQFAYVAAHDLQEPLRMVASYTELLSERYSGQLDERADLYIAYAVDGSKRMKHLVSDLLLYSRVQSRGRELEPVAMSGVVAGVMNEIRGAVTEARAEIVTGDMPTVLGDEGQIRQVLANLLSNAIKFRSDTPPKIEIAARRAGEYWEISVADNGIGIEMQYADRIFQMFQRLHERGRYDGSGIGLAIARKIVERHGGEIWFESEPGKGTVFRFTLPATAGEST